MKILQIGSNRENDDVFRFIKDKEIEFIILVEPLPFLINDLIECYKDIKNVYIEQIAIVPKEIESGKVLMYYNVCDGPGFEISSLNEGYTGSAKSIEVECKTITQLLDKYKIKELDYFFIDAEGMDDSIILSLDLKKYSIKNIEYEHLHLKNAPSLIRHFTDNDYIPSPVIPSENGYNAAYAKK